MSFTKPKNMKYLLIIAFIFSGIYLFGQNTEDQLIGNVSYISSQHVYVKFVNTDGIHIGDTLFVVKNNKTSAVLIVKSLSSISCIGTPITTQTLPVTTQIMARKRLENAPIDVIAQESESALTVNDQAIKEAGKKSKDSDSKARFDGRLSVSSYSTISDYNTTERLRYNLSLNAEHIGNSNLSAESYISFTHLHSFPAKPTDWKGINNALKIYNLALKYDFGKTARIFLGRKINVNMANIGAVDGIQFEKAFSNFTVGALAGSRPNDSTYGFDPTLLQYGGFVSHNIQKENGYMQTSLAFFNQMNKLKTDRRFAYFQHSNSLLKNVDLFCSFEFDLFSKIDSVPTNTLNLTSTYLSLRYRPWRQLSMSLSYDARKNIHYFETYKNSLDSLLDKITRQGFRFNTTIRPFKYFMLGGNAGYRLPTNIRQDTLASTNANLYMSYTQLPLDLVATITATAYKAGYTNGTVYGIALSRDFISGKLNVEGEYRKANYYYSNSNLPTAQNIAELSLSWRIAKKLTLSANFEATFEKGTDGVPNNMQRAFINISQRF